MAFLLSKVGQTIGQFRRDKGDRKHTALNRARQEPTLDYSRK